jgi:hypothetical protein
MAIDDETRARARKFVADNAGESAPAAKPRVVSKKELEASMPEAELVDDTKNQRRFPLKAANMAAEARVAKSPAKAKPSVYQAEKLGGREKMSEPKVQDVGRKADFASIPDSIPLDGPREVSGEPIISAEFGRRFENVLAAVGGAGAMAAAAKAKKMYDAAQKAKSLAAEVARRAELAGELRRGAQPTKFVSASRPTAAKSTRKFADDEANIDFRKGGKVQKYASGGSVSSRADGIAQRGKTRGRVC